MIRSAGLGCTESPLEGRFGNGFVAVIGQGVEHAPGAVRALAQQNRDGGLQRGVTEIIRAGMAVDAIQKGRQIDELVASFDELQVEKFLFGGHGRHHTADLCRFLPQNDARGPNGSKFPTGTHEKG